MSVIANGLFADLRTKWNENLNAKPTENATITGGSEWKLRCSRWMGKLIEITFRGFSVFAQTINGYMLHGILVVYSKNNYRTPHFVMVEVCKKDFGWEGWKFWNIIFSLSLFPNIFF
jgi:hypothetical protein